MSSKLGQEVRKPVYLDEPFFAVRPDEMVVGQDATRLVATHLCTQVQASSLRCTLVRCSV